MGDTTDPGCPRKTWCVRNVSGFSGQMDGTEALAKSPNTAFTKLISQIGGAPCGGHGGQTRTSLLRRDMIRAEFPDCPPVRVEAIAFYVAVRCRGHHPRYDPTDLDSVRQTITGFVRHTDTCYDDMLLRGFDRDESRQRVQSHLDRILDAWHNGFTVRDA